jgi:hypothetical protein
MLGSVLLLAAGLAVGPPQEVLTIARGGVMTPRGRRFDERPKPEMFVNRGLGEPEVWGDLQVWATTPWEAGTKHSEGALACQQHFFSAEKMACGFRLAVGLVELDAANGRVEYVRVDHFEAQSRSPDGSAWIDPTEEASHRCQRYLLCLAEYGYLGRVAPWNDALPDEVFGTLIGTVMGGAGPAATRSRAQKEYDKLVGVLERQHVPEGELERAARLRATTPENRGFRRVATMALYFRWLLELEPWKNWDAFVASRLSIWHRRPIVVD